MPDATMTAGKIWSPLEQAAPRAEDVRTRSRHLFSLVVESASVRRLLALEVADDLEWMVSSLGAGPGQWLGAERDLARRFSVGPRVMRQACRSLVARGMIESRRGKTGGYLIAREGKPHALQAFCAALAAPGCDTQALEALAQVGGMLRQQACIPAAFALELLEAVASGQARPAAASASNLAESIAQQIESEISVWRARSAEDRSGVLEAMSEHYGVSLHLVVQAVRLLEDNGVLQMKKGRIGGIVATSEPTWARAIRAAHAYFSTHGVTVADCDRLVRLLNISMIERATRNATGPLEPIEEALARMRSARDPTSVGTAWYALQRALSDRAANLPLHGLVKCFAAYVVRFRTCRSDIDRIQARTLVNASERIVDNIRAGRADDSAEAHIECQEALRVSW